MMKQKFGKSAILIPVGLLFLAGTFITNHYFEIPDFTNGILFGTGIGLMIIPFVKKYKDSKSRRVESKQE